MKIPTRQEAYKLLSEARKLNPGPWVQHSVFVAKAAEAIAQVHPNLDPPTAYVLGYLHDIGRREGKTGLRHMIDGYCFLQSLGFGDVAQISLTHSFPVKSVDAVTGQWNCSTKELKFVQDYLSRVEYSAYDKLIQLCDALALPTGFCLIEKRLVDVALRHGVNDLTVLRWKGYFDVQYEFEKAIAGSIYGVLPGVIENTFGFHFTTRERTQFVRD